MASRLYWEKASIACMVVEHTTYNHGHDVVMLIDKGAVLLYCSFASVRSSVPGVRCILLYLSLVPSAELEGGVEVVVASFLVLMTSVLLSIGI